MAHPYHHAVSSVKKWGGKPEDYQRVHDWFDASKAHLADFRHRALRHHSEGIFMAEQVFGTNIYNSEGRAVPVRFIGEQHVIEDCGFIPTVADWLQNIQAQPWMKRVGRRLSKELEKDDFCATRTPSETDLRQSEVTENKGDNAQLLRG